MGIWDTSMFQLILKAYQESGWLSALLPIAEARSCAVKAA